MKDVGINEGNEGNDQHYGKGNESKPKYAEESRNHSSDTANHHNAAAESVGSVPVFFTVKRPR